MLTVLNVAYPFAPVGPDAVGGAEQILSAIDAALVRAGARSLVLACKGSQTAGKLLPVEVPEGPLTDRIRADVAEGLRPRIENIVEHEHVDLVHFHGIGFSRSLPRNDTPVLATLHLPPSWYAPEVFAPGRPDTWLNCVSASQRRACPPSPILIEEIGNGVDLTRFGPTSTRDDYALVLGRVCPEKGIHLAIEAAKWAGIALVIAGQVFPHPEHIRYFREQIEPRLDRACFFLGPVNMPRKAELLARARCVVVPSVVAETSSLVTMEALASGTPVVALPKGALPDLIDHGRTGLLVNDVPEMRDALVRVKALRSEECRRDAEERFGQEGMCARYLAAYQRLASPARVRRALLTADEITGVASLRELEPEWAALWQRCPGATVFQRPEWLLPWCAHLLRGGLTVLALRRAGRLVALAPFFRWKDGAARVLSLLGAGVSDYADVLIEAGEERAAIPAIAEWLRQSPGWDRIECSEVRHGSPLLSVLQGWAVQEVCPGLALDPAVPVQDVIPQRTWRNAAYARRRAARETGIAIEDATEATLDAHLDALESVHAARWSLRGEAGMLAQPAIRAFHREAARRLQRRGALLLRALRFGDAVAGVLYGFLDRGVTRICVTGFLRAHARRSPGAILYADAIERAHRGGNRLFDFMRGAERYKYRWGASDVARLHRCRVTREAAARPGRSAAIRQAADG